MDITEEAVLAAVDAMRDVVSTTGVQLFNIYARQVYVQGIVQCIVIPIMLIVLAYIAYRLHRWGEQPDSEGSNWTNFERNDGAQMLFAIICVCVLIATPLVCISFIDGIMMMLNPEYYVIQMLLHSIGL